MYKKGLSPAKKAALTRKVRSEFSRMYPETYDVVCDLVRNNDLSCYPTSYVAAVKANLHRPGNYRNMAMLCNF